MWRPQLLAAVPALVHDTVHKAGGLSDPGDAEHVSKLVPAETSL